jgi:hypothetical protein
VYFTNVCGQYETGATSAKTDISDIVYIDAQDPTEFATNEKPTYKNSFKTVKEKKFFNWTNPAMFQTYDYFRGEFDGGGEDNTLESWKYTTMTSF